MPATRPRPRQPARKGGSSDFHCSTGPRPGRAAGQRFLQERESLADELPSARRHAGDVPAWPTETGHEPGLGRIAPGDRDDRYRRRRLPGGRGRGGSPDHQHVHLEPDELSGGVGQRVVVSDRGAILEHNVLTVGPAELHAPALRNTSKRGDDSVDPTPRRPIRDVLVDWASATRGTATRKRMSASRPQSRVVARRNTFDQRLQLRPGDGGMDLGRAGERREAAVGAGDDVLAADHARRSARCARRPAPGARRGRWTG